MLRLENIPPEEMPQIVHIASELYEKDQAKEAESQHRKATVDAAQEMGIPEEYLHRAAAELHSRRIAQVQQRKRNRAGLIAVAGAILVIGAGAFFVTGVQTERPATVITESVQTAPTTPFSASNWKISTNRGTQATVTYNNNAAILKVQRFATAANGQYFANLNSTDGAKNLSGARSISFRVRGTLPNVRLYLERGTERWRSPAIGVQSGEQIVRLDLDQFEYQTRARRESAWRTAPYKAPEWVDTLSFKSGWFVNDIYASGDVELSDLRIE